MGTGRNHSRCMPGGSCAHLTCKLIAASGWQLRSGAEERTRAAPVGSTSVTSDSAGQDLDGCTAVARLPRPYASGQSGAVVPVADAVQHVQLDLAGAVFDAKAGRSSKQLDYFVSEVDRSTRKRIAAAVSAQTPTC